MAPGKVVDTEELNRQLNPGHALDEALQEGYKRFQESEKEIRDSLENQAPLPSLDNDRYVRLPTLFTVNRGTFVHAAERDAFRVCRPSLYSGQRTGKGGRGERSSRGRTPEAGR